MVNGSCGARRSGVMLSTRVRTVLVRPTCPGAIQHAPALDRQPYTSSGAGRSNPLGIQGPPVHLLTARWFVRLVVQSHAARVLFPACRPVMDRTTSRPAGTGPFHEGHQSPHPTRSLSREMHTHPHAPEALVDGHIMVHAAHRPLTELLSFHRDKRPHAWLRPDPRDRDNMGT